MNDKSVAALLTGRGGSSFKGKNTVGICGRPAMWFPAMAARNSNLIGAWYCSSDDDDILGVAESCGYKKIRRPNEISGATSQHIEAIAHGLCKMEEDGCTPDIVVVLLANNVCVETRWIDDCIGMLKDNPKATSAVPVYKDNDHHPLRAKRLCDGMLVPFALSAPVNACSTNRQDLDPCYFLCHNFWCIRTSSIIENRGYPPWSFMGDTVLPYEVDKTIDIHAAEDIAESEKWVKAHHVAHGYCREAGK